MKAYSNGITKTKFVKELQKHQKWDSFVKGTYTNDKAGKEFRGCAVGCGVESINRLKKTAAIEEHSDHRRYAEALGIPEWLARVEDRLFEGVSAQRAKTWPLEFAQALKTGKNYEKILRPFLIVCVERTYEDYDTTKYANILGLQKKLVKLLKKKGQEEAIKAVREELRAYAVAAAADAAADAYAAAAAAYAAAYAAAADAADAYAADAAADAARTKRFEFLADELIRLIKSVR